MAFSIDPEPSRARTLGRSEPFGARYPYVGTPNPWALGTLGNSEPLTFGRPGPLKSWTPWVLGPLWRGALGVRQAYNFVDFFSSCIDRASSPEFFNVPSFT